MSRVLVLGSGGMLGHKVLQRLAAGHDVVGTLRGDPGDPPYGRIPLFAETPIIGGVDATAWPTVAAALDRTAPDVVVNAIGVVKQREAAHDPIPSITVNALLPHLLAAACATAGARLIHISTDCVFSGGRGTYTEDDVPDATDLYGRSKLLGEVADRDHVLTLRTSLVGRELTGFRSLLEWFLRAGPRVTGYRRAIFSGVSTLWMADCVARLIDDHRDLHGLYQVASPAIDKHALLGLFAEAFATGTEVVADDAVAIDRSLDGGRFAAATGIQAPSWEQMAADLAADPTPYEEWT